MHILGARGNRHPVGRNVSFKDPYLDKGSGSSHAKEDGDLTKSMSRNRVNSDSKIQTNKMKRKESDLVFKDIVKDAADIDEETGNMAEKTLQLVQDKGSVNLRMHFYLLVVFIFAVAGIFLMVLENETLISNNYHHNWETQLLKLLITTTTVIAELGLYKYYMIVSDSYKVQNSILLQDARMPWYVGFNYAVEAFVIGIHPLPYLDSSINVTGANETTITYPWDTILSVAMLSRVYLVYRMMKYFIGYHLRKAQIVGRFNSVNMSAGFAIKSFLHVNPYPFLLSSLLLNIFLVGYAVRLCEYNLPDSHHRNFLETIWFMFVTISTVGYGDVFVKSYCGRTAVVFGSVWGFVTTALMIGIIDQSLQMSFSQVRIVNLLAKENWKSKIKNQAALLIQRVWRLKRSESRTYSDIHKVYGTVFRWKKMRREYKIFLERSEAVIKFDPMVEHLLTEVQRLGDKINKVSYKIDKIQYTLERKKAEHDGQLSERSRTSTSESLIEGDGVFKLGELSTSTSGGQEVRRLKAE
eukprot:TRINITY_DN9056_c0_g1_i2.p1 TRINITY_DN9056_c0_g1~~TRINITY_DN9056_c0_g1_i2.p1  ORF type:complete len:524 (+),score=70.89 TRINITY_DN9056_c0_g1_i2:78-1649(+)